MQTWYKLVLVEHKHGVNLVQTSTLASQGLLGMVGGPAHGRPRVDVVQLAACARARGALVTLAKLEELLLAMSHRSRDGAVVPCRDEGQPPQNGDDWDNVDDRPRLRLIQLLRSALTRLPPPAGGVPAADRNLTRKFTLSLLFVYKIDEQFTHCLHVVCILFTLSYNVVISIHTLFTCSLHFVHTKLQCYALSPAVRRIVVERIDQGTVAVHQNGPTVSILLVRLHPDTEQQGRLP